MKRIRLLFCFLLLFSGCSTLSKNMVKSGKVNLNGGVKGQKTWHDTLEFNRLSWFQELTMYFDLLYTKVDSNNPFSHWFSTSERRMANSCKELYLVVSYSLDSKKISRNEFVQQMSKQGYKEIALPHFEQNLRLHPDYAQLSFGLYKFHGFCLKTQRSKEPFLIFPGYGTQKVF